jgi:CRP-like cAMP-binding protein
LLAALSSEARETVLAAAEPVRLASRTVLDEPGRHSAFVYFPLDAVVSVLKVMCDGTQVEVLTVGREGLTGVRTLLGGVPANDLVVVHLGGDAYRIPVEMLRLLLDDDVAIRSILERFVATQLDAAMQSIACARLHSILQRCARRLLMTGDRLGREDFPLTHESLASVLGVRRAGVSVAAAELQEAGGIAYSRGHFTIVDRERLRRSACECYSALTALAQPLDGDGAILR